jgi:hypothetical protein
MIFNNQEKERKEIELQNSLKKVMGEEKEEDISGTSINNRVGKSG